MFQPKKSPQLAESDAGGMDEESRLKDEILAELVEVLQAGLGKDLDKKARPEGLEIDILAAEEPKAIASDKPMELDLDDEDEELG